jgi:CBS domain-containing protein
MKVAEVMVHDVVTIDATATLLEAANRMREANIGVLPVIDGQDVIGVITDRDLVVRGMARNLDPIAAKVEDCATTEPVCAHPNWDVEEALHMMADHQVGRLPVVDDAGSVVGMVTLSSVALRSGDGEDTLGTAREVSRRSTRGSRQVRFQ